MKGSSFAEGSCFIIIIIIIIVIIIITLWEFFHISVSW